MVRFGWGTRVRILLSVSPEARSLFQRVSVIGAFLAFAYLVLVGGTSQGELQPSLRLLNAGIAGVAILIYLLRAPGRMDRIDQAVLLGLLCFAAAGMLSRFPRQSLDAVLAALSYTAAFFIARDLLATEQARAMLVRTMMGLSLVMTFITAALWLPLVAEWWSLTGWSVIPPLNISLNAQPWGHRHDLALLVAMLYPSWWMGRRTSLRAATATVVGVLAILIVLVDGSRLLWLALGAATIPLLLPTAVRQIRGSPRSRAMLLGAGAALSVMLVMTGVASALVDRILNWQSLSARSAIWEPLVEVWLSRPVAGLGPGSFPWVLQETSYFDTTTWAPRHPDSVLFQLLPEAGILGVLALTVIAVTILPPLLRSDATGARWALTAFAVAGLAANPTDFAFLIVPAIAWAAYALPHAEAAPAMAPTAKRWTRSTTLGIASVIGVAYLATVGAGFSYGGAGAAIAQGDLVVAEARLDEAISLDPGMALYWRQRGALHLLADDPRAAVLDLEQAIARNPNDDLAWRTLALAHATSGDTAARRLAVDRAVALQRSDLTNLLLVARWQMDEKDADADGTLSEIVHGWPTIVAAPRWAEFTESTASTPDIIAEATDRWLQQLPPPGGLTNQGMTLVALTGRTDLLDAAMQEARVTPSMAKLFLAVATCDPGTTTLFESASDTDKRTSAYWSLRVRASAATGEIDGDALRLVEIMGGGRTIDDSVALETLNPLHENGSHGFSGDTWGYRRPPVSWPEHEIWLPSLQAASARWMLDPISALEEADLDERLAECSPH